MARNGRNGRIFFYFSTDFFADRKIKILKARYGADGITLYIYLLCEIYREEGYFLRYDDDAKYIIAAELNMNYEKIGQILNFLLERSLFDNTLFQSDKVLTSREIQITFQDAVKTMGSKNPVLVSERLWLLEKNETAAYIQTQAENENSGKSAPFSGKTTDFSGKSATKQRKVKESKGKQSKAKQSRDPHADAPAAAAPSIEKVFHDMTGRRFSDTDIRALEEMRDSGASDALILRVMEKVAGRGNAAVGSMRYYLPIVTEALSRAADKTRGRCPGTFDTTEIETILDEEFAAWVQDAGSGDYSYDE